MEDDLDFELIKRLRYIEGQARGVQRMLAEKRDPTEVLIQVAAIRAAAAKVAEKLMEVQLRDDLTRQLGDRLAACPGSCERCDSIEELLQEVDLAQTLAALSRAASA